MKEQLGLRADALAGECVEEFLTTRRSKEQWDRVSLMQDKMIKLDAKVLFFITNYNTKL